MNFDNLKGKPIPLRFFVITFLWSWLLWLPFVLAGLGIWEWNESLRSSLSMPVIILGAFGPGMDTGAPHIGNRNYCLAIY